MCFDCCLPFSAKKTLNGLSRPNTPGADSPEGYGPPLRFNLNLEELPEIGENDSKDVTQVEHDDSGNTQDGTEPQASMNTSSGKELDVFKLVDMDSDHKEPSDFLMADTKPNQVEFACEQDIKVETSLNDQLPIAETADCEVTNDTLSTLQSDQKLDDAGNGKDEEKMGRSKNAVLVHLEVGLEYKEILGHLKVAIMKATDLPNKKQGGFSNYRIRFSLRPNKQHSSKTQIRPVDSAVFRELFSFYLPKEELSVSELIFNLYGCRKYGRERMVGDAILNLSAMKAEAKQTFNISLVQNVQ